ncbi:MAG: SDR family oxidoreductase [Gammaproteobacteria bacterium]|nr:SDR family oxidoreductase [Gammaproteobacteria bacterium]
MPTILVTGCNRGIGLELCRQYAARGDAVIGACRTASDELRETGARVIEDIDVGTADGVKKLAAAIGGERIDVLVNNAGILRRDSLDTVDYEDMIEQFRVNTIGPLRVTRALADNLGKGSKVGIVSSRVGSIADNSSGGNYGYRCSKAAVNMAGMNLHHELSPRGIAVMLLHPGYVMTGMTGGSGNTTAADSAKGLIARLDELELATSGSFRHAEGYDLPW